MRLTGPRTLAAVKRLDGPLGKTMVLLGMRPSEPREALPPPNRPAGSFLDRNFWPWFQQYLGAAFHKKHEFPPFTTGNGVLPIGNTCTLVLAADWGTGTIPAYAVVDKIRDLRMGLEQNNETLDVTIHLGDVYYSGTPGEYADWFLGDEDWPRGDQLTLAMNANHEMYSGGNGYFGALAAIHQQTSYFCLENDHWRILGLDSGYFSGYFPLFDKVPLLGAWYRTRVRLHDDILRWLATIVFRDPNDQRPVVLLTHHQLFSAFGKSYPTLGVNLAPYLGRVFLWLWGHEHRFAGYGPVSVRGLPPVRARCIGHGGMPVESVDQPPPEARAKETNLVFYDNRREPARSRELNQPIGYCGFAAMRLEGKQLSLRYIDENGLLLLEEVWSQENGKVSGAARLGTEPLEVVHPRGIGGLIDG